MTELTLLPEELFFLAKLCKGKRLNYDYIAMVPDLQHRARTYWDNCIKNLEKKEILTDDWGELIVSEEATALLAPLWNGTFESSAQQITLGEQPTSKMIRFHRLGDTLCLAYTTEEGIFISAAAEEDILAVISVLMPEGYADKVLPEELTITAAEADGMIVLKNILTSGEQAVVEAFYCVNGWICRETAPKEYQILDVNSFASIANFVLRGE